MPRLKTTDKLEDLKTKQKQLQAQIRDLEAKAKVFSTGHRYPAQGHCW